MGLYEIINTPERREDARLEQEKMREKYGARLAQHPAQAMFMFGMAKEQSALDQLQGVKDGVLGRGEEDRLFNQLAEGLALQGKFQEAAEICQSEPHKAEYLAKAEAVKHVGVGCQCPPIVVKPSPTDAKGQPMETRHKVEEVFDGKAIVTLTKCLLCGAFAAQIG